MDRREVQRDHVLPRDALAPGRPKHMLVRSLWVAGHKAKSELVWKKKWVFINSHSLMTGRAVSQLGTVTNQGLSVTNQGFQIPPELCC